MESFWLRIAADWFAIAAAAGAIGTVVLLGELLHHRSGWKGTASRRIVHLGTGLIVAGLPYLFEYAAGVYLLAGIFLAVNTVSVAKGWLQGMHQVGRETVGTVTFPLALLVALPMSWQEDRIFALQTAFLVLAVADPLAAWIGAKADPHRKTWQGSLTFGAAAAVVTGIALAVFPHPPWSWPVSIALVGLVSLVATAVEALGGKGWDNFFIVGAVVVLLVAWIEHPFWQKALLGAGTLGIGFGVFSWWFSFLTLRGSIAGGLFAATLVGLGGVSWGVPAVAFFVLSSLLSKANQPIDKRTEALSPKDSRRRAKQVYANGGVAWGLLILHSLYPSEWFFWGFLGAIAAATADTWSTEIGTRVSGPPRMLLTGRQVPPGTSGAVSWMGTAGGLLGAVIIWGCAWLAASAEVAQVGLLTSFVTVVGGGMTGAFADSIAGETVQALYQDARTGHLTERPTAKRVKGWGWMDNERVNWLCTLVGASVAAASSVFL